MRHRASQIRSPVLWFLGWGLGLLPSLASAQGYGYEKSQDPLIIGVKGVIAAAREDRPKEVEEQLQALAPSIEEVEKGLGVALAPGIERARVSKNAVALAYALTELVYHHLRWKLERNRATELLPHLEARKRLEAARHYYDEILSFSVRRADSVRKTEHHAEILEAFRAMKAALGSEGLFGVGARAPRPDEFEKGAERALRPLRAVYADFTPPRTGEFGASPPREESEGKDRSPPGGGGGTR